MAICLMFWCSDYSESIHKHTLYKDTSHRTLNSNIFKLLFTGSCNYECEVPRWTLWIVSWWHHLLYEWLWVNHVGILACFFLLYKVEIIISNSQKMCVYQIECICFQAIEIPIQNGILSSWNWIFQEQICLEIWLHPEFK